MNLKYFLIVSVFFTFYNSPTFAEKTHGIAMHGKPKYEEGFTHLDYVNSNAPKGGVVRFCVRRAALHWTTPETRKHAL